MSRLYMRYPKTLRLVIAGAIATAAPLPSLCQTLIKGPTRIIVPVGPGSTTDVSARIVAEMLTTSFGQPFVVENKAGGSGALAAEVLKNATPSGSTLLFAPIAVPVIVPLVYKNLSFDPSRDFAPVGQVARFTFALAVKADHPAQTLPEFVTWAKSHPGKANFATAGVGGIPHILGVMLNHAAGIDMVHVPYTTFAAQEANLLGGQVVASIDAVPNVIAMERAGKIRVLATTGAERSPLLPAVPTFKEQGYPMIVAVGWNALFAPANTPGPVIKRLSAAIVERMQSIESQQKFTALGLEPTGTTPEVLAAIMAADTARWAAIIKATGVMAE